MLFHCSTDPELPGEADYMAMSASQYRNIAAWGVPAGQSPGPGLRRHGGDLPEGRPGHRGEGDRLAPRPRRRRRRVAERAARRGAGREEGARPEVPHLSLGLAGGRRREPPLRSRRPHRQSAGRGPLVRPWRRPGRLGRARSLDRQKNRQPASPSRSRELERTSTGRQATASGLALRPDGSRLAELERATCGTDSSLPGEHLTCGSRLYPSERRR